jgi:hypothetical protein
VRFQVTPLLGYTHTNAMTCPPRGLTPETTKPALGGLC